MKQLILFTLCFFAINVGFSQSHKTCKKKMMEVLTAMNAPPFPEAKEVYQMDFSHHYYFWDTLSRDNYSTTNTLSVSGIRMYMDGKEISLYQDTSNVFLILHHEKKIIWSKSPGLGNAVLRKQTQTAMQDSSLFHAEVSNCKSFVKDGEQQMQITLIPNKKYSTLNLVQQRLTFSLGDNHFKVVESWFNQNDEVKKLKVEYHKVDFDAKGRLKKSAKMMVIDKKGNLLPQFAGYELITQ